MTDTSFGGLLAYATTVAKFGGPYIQCILCKHFGGLCYEQILVAHVHDMVLAALRHALVLAASASLAKFGGPLHTAEEMAARNITLHFIHKLGGPYMMLDDQVDFWRPLACLEMFDNFGGPYCT